MPRLDHDLVGRRTVGPEGEGVVEDVGEEAGEGDAGGAEGEAGEGDGEDEEGGFEGAEVGDVGVRGDVAGLEVGGMGGGW